MSTTQANFNNYFLAAKKLLDAWVEQLKAMNPEGAKGPEMQKTISEYEKWIADFAKHVEGSVEKEIERIKNLTPEDVQKATLEGITKFEDVYKKANDAILKALENEKTYVASPEFITDVKERREKATNLYNAAVSSITKVIDHVSDLIKGMNKS